jgi:CheY-like chemotaxis protein
MSAPRILVADDDAWILRMVTTVLEKRGYAVDTAADGEEALKKAITTRPDLVITDVMMPRMDGWTLVKQLRARPEFAFVPVIFLTALGSDDDRIKGFRLGADDYMPKPFRFEELDLRVANTLRRRAGVERAARAEIDRPGPQAAPPVRSAKDPPPPPVPRVGLAGTLGQVGLSSLLTLLELERKSGILVVTAKTGEVVRIFIDNGRVVQAFLEGRDELRHAEVVYFALRWSEGTFSFTSLEVEMDDEIESTTTHLLMEGARRIDEQSPGR